MRMVTVSRLNKLLLLGAFIAFAFNRNFLIPFLMMLLIAVFVGIRLRCPKCGRNVYLKRINQSAISDRSDSDYESDSMAEQCYGCGTNLRQVEFEWNMLSSKWKASDSTSSNERSLPKQAIFGLLLMVVWFVGVTAIQSNDVSARGQAGFFGFMFVLMGAYILMNRRRWVNAMHGERQSLLGKWLGLRPWKWEPTFMVGITMFMGVVCMLSGLLMLYTFVTGRDWPLHHARWSDLWPF